MPQLESPHPAPGATWVEVMERSSGRTDPGWFSSWRCSSWRLGLLSPPGSTGWATAEDPWFSDLAECVGRQIIPTSEALAIWPGVTPEAPILNDGIWWVWQRRTYPWRVAIAVTVSVGLGALLARLIVPLKRRVSAA
jgi:hypothetical protein